MESNFAAGAEEDRASVAAFVEQSRKSSDAAKGLQAVGGEFKKLKKQVWIGECSCVSFSCV
jgi:hypothetical protein